MTDEELMQQYPDLPWLEPLKITVHGHGGPHWRLCCRLCIARFGMKGNQVVEQGFKTRQEFFDHLEEKHGIKP